MCLRKDVAVETGGFSERKDFATVEDYEYWLRLSQAGDFYFLDEVLGEWHTHSGNYSSRAVKIHVDAQIAVKKYHFDLWLHKFPHAGKMVRRGHGKMWATSGNLLRKAKKFNAATKYARKAISIYPFYLKAWAVLILAVLRHS